METEKVNNMADWWFTDERITAQEAAEIAGINLSTFYNYRHTGKLIVPDYRYGVKKFFKKSELQDAIIGRVKHAGIGK